VSGHDFFLEGVPGFSSHFPSLNWDGEL
jgi:hypothetical protein